jgi:imidazolonepropionase-like amidohydrolase
MLHGGQPLSIADGVDECIKAVRTLVRRGARVIKVCSSGGVLSLNDDPEDRQFSDEELAAIVQEAGRTRRAVAAHAIGRAGIMAGLRAGVKSIEHGCYLDEELADLMIEKDAIFVGTHHIIRVIEDDYLDNLPGPMKRKFLALVEKSKASYRIAIDKGVKIALGTDTVSSSRASALSHGKNAHELVYAVELGMTPLHAIESATANAPETLGGMAPLSGQIREGYDADIIAVKSSPLDNVGVLTDEKNITHVWKGGKLFKSPSKYSRVEEA